MTDLGHNLGYDLGPSVGYDIAPDFIDLITYANASPRIAINPVTGAVTEFPADVPAITTINGKRYVQVERAVENSALYSNDFTQYTLNTGLTIGGNQDQAGPAGNTASLILESASNSVHRIYTTYSHTGTYTWSMCVKKYGSADRWLRLQGTNNISRLNMQTYAWDTLGAGNSSHFVIPLSGGWYRVGFTSVGAGTSYFAVGLSDSASNDTYTGSTSVGLYVWQRTIQPVNYATSPIRTVASAVTRAKDEPLILAASVPIAIKDKVTVSAYPEWADTQLVAGDERTLIEYADTTQNIRCYYDGADKKVKVAGRLKNLVSATNVWGVFVYADIIYYTLYGGKAIYSVPLSGGAPTPLITGLSAEPTGITSDGTYIYYTIYSGADTGIWRATIAGADATKLTNSVNNPQQLWLTSIKLYWGDYTSGKVISYTLVGGAVTDEVTGLTNPTGVCTDATNLYWSDQATGKISYRPLAGGGTVDLVTGLTAPQCIAIDAVNIYWTSAGGLIRSAPLSTGTPYTISTNGALVYRGLAVYGTTLLAAAIVGDYVQSIFKAPFASSATTHSANQKITAALDRVAGTLTLSGFTTGNGVTTGIPWNRTNGIAYVGEDALLETQFDSDALRLE